jgi:DNA (cytosine-5)-methyltransferase 1
VDPVKDKKPLLSLFPGIDLFGRGFEAEGFCVLRGPDILYGGDIRSFHAPRGVIQGVFGGPPCPDFSPARRNPPTGYGVEMLNEFRRLVTETEPQWYLVENSVRVPDVIVPGYKLQRFNLNAKECGAKQNRPRCFQFGSLDGKPLVIPRPTEGRGESQPCCMATEGTKTNRRNFSDFCEIQGLPRDFDLPGMSVAAKYRAVGNGVNVLVARVVARAIARRHVTPMTRLCECDCGRPVAGNQRLATPACRKRMQRKRDAAGVTSPGFVTPGTSHCDPAALSTSWADTVTGPQFT